MAKGFNSWLKKKSPCFLAPDAPDSWYLPSPLLRAAIACFFSGTMLLAAVLRWLADLLVLAVLSALAILFRNGEM
ncbi:MAG: hypothetical protein ACK5WL_03995, partial [Pseudanabaena sp.]